VAGETLVCCLRVKELTGVGVVTAAITTDEMLAAFTG
jgi:hypothetical protein